MDVNASTWDCTLEASSQQAGRQCGHRAIKARECGAGASYVQRPLGSALPPTVYRLSLRLGFTMVRGLGARAREVLERERARGPYRSIADFVRRTGLDRDAVERLAEVGAFLRFDERRAAIWQRRRVGRAEQPRPSAGPGRSACRARPTCPPMDAWESTRADYAGLWASRQTGISSASTARACASTTSAPQRISSSWLA